jgi:putative transposase
VERADGTKELVALSDGFRESSESWADLLRDCKRRGMTAPVLAVGDGRWVLEGDPRRRSRHQGAALLVAQDRQRARRAPEGGAPGREEGPGRDLQRREQGGCGQGRPQLRDRDGAKWPKAVAKIVDDLDVLTAFYDYPAEHWIHLRTTNPI